MCIVVEVLPLPHSKNDLKGPEDGLAGKGLCCQAWQPECDPRAHMVEVKKLTPQVSDLLAHA